MSAVRATIRPRFPALAGGTDLVLLVPACALAIAVAFAITHRGPLVAAALIVAPIVAVLVARRYGGLAIGIALVLAVPSWTVLGTAQITVLRLASLFALATAIRNRGIRPNLCDAALAGFVVVSILDWVLNYQQPGAGRVLSTEMTPIGFYLGARALPRERWPSLMLITLLAGTLGALTVIYEFARGHVVFANAASYDWNASTSFIFRPGGIFGSPPAASTVLCVVALVGIACIKEHVGKLRMVSVGCTALVSFALVLTFTRAALIALAVGVLVFLWLTRSRLLRPLRVAWFVAGVVVLYVFVAPALQSNTTFQKGVLRPGTLTQRESYWGVALPVATANLHTFVFGIGTGALEAPRTSSSAAVAQNVAVTPQLTVNSLHSQYITTLLEQGVVGLLLLVAALVLAAGRAAYTARTAGSALAASVTAGIVGIAVIMSVDTALLDGPSFAMLMVVLGLAGAMRTRQTARTEESISVPRLTPPQIAASAGP